MHVAPLLFSLTITVSWGITWFLTARASKHLGAVHSLFLFQLVGLPFLLPLFPFFHTAISITNLIYIIVLGIVMTSGMLAFFYATKVGDISVVNPISDTYLILIVLLGVIFLHESLSLIKVFAIIIVFIGVLLLGIDIKAIMHKTGKRLLAGVLPALFSTINTAVGLFLIAIITRQGNWLYTTFGIRVMVTLVTLVVLVQRKEQVKKLFTNIPWKWMIPAAFFDVVGFALYNYTVTITQVSYVAAFVSSQSLIGVMLAHIFLKERLASYQYLALPLVVGGLVLLNLA